jgi:phage-related minor tail protein
LARSNIRGITIEIGGDTQGLNRALEDVNKKTRDTQTELRQVERLLRMDPTNTELLAQRQQLLTNAVSSTSEKLEILRRAQEQVNQQFARGEIGEEQYRAFQREIAATEQQLRSFEGRLSNTVDSLDEVGDSAESSADRIAALGERLSSTGDKIKGAGEKMSVGITAPIVAAGGLMFKGALDAENAQRKLQASLGITAEEASNLGAVAEEVWKKGFGESIEEANDAISTITKNMGALSEEEFKSIAEGAMTIAEVFGAEVPETTAAAGVAMKAFGISSQDALDLITVGFQQGGDYSGELIDTLREYSPQFAAMGLSAEQMMGVLISGAQAGAWNLDKVGDAAKEFNIRAQDGSKTTAEGFAAIGLNAQEMGEAIAKGGEEGQQAFMATIAALAAMENPMEQNIAGTALFGTQWEDVRSQVIVAMADGMKGIGDFKGSTEEATRAMRENNPGIALTQAMRELQAAIGPALLPLADIIKNTIVPAIKSLADWFINLSPAGQKTALAIAGIAAAIGPILVVIGSLIGAVGSIAAAFATASGAIAAAGGAMAIITGPVGIAIAAIAALAVAAYLIISNWEPIKEFFINLWASITSTITAAWEGIKQFFNELPGAIATTLTTAIEVFGQWGANLITWVATAIPQVINNITSFFNELPGKIGYALGFALGTLLKWGLDAINWVITEVPKIITGVVTFFTELPGKLATVFTNVITEFGKWGTNAATWITTEVPKLIANIVNFFTELPGKIAKFLADVVIGLATWASNMKAKAAEEAPKIVDKIIEFFNELPGKMLDIGVNIVKGLWEGIQSMAGWIGGMVSDFVSGLVAGAKAALGISSPSKVFAEIGKNISLGMAEGIILGADSVQSALNGLYSSAGTLGNISVGVSGSSAGGSAISNSYTFAPGSIVIPAKDLSEMRKIQDFFNKLPQVARQGV